MRRNGVNSCGSANCGGLEDDAMIVRYFWPSCDYRQKNWDATSMDCFWVEATHEEAIQSVFPLLSRELELDSEELAAECEDLAKTISQPLRPCCFLVARDLSSIDPFEVHYPSHQLWNGYSPFRSLPDHTITSLHELAGICVE